MWNPFRIFSEHDYRWNELDKRLTDAFEKIKTERRLIFSWVNYLRKKDFDNDKLQQKIRFALGKHDVAIQNLQDQIKGLKEELKMAKSSPFPDQVRTKSGLESGLVSGPKPESRLITRIVSMIRPQRKEYVMQKILDMVENGDNTTKQIETVIVKEKGLCGRTAFYDYLKELKYKNLIRTAQKKGRKVLVSENI